MTDPRRRPSAPMLVALCSFAGAVACFAVVGVALVRVAHEDSAVFVVPLAAVVGTIVLIVGLAVLQTAIGQRRTDRRIAAAHPGTQTVWVDWRGVYGIATPFAPHTAERRRLSDRTMFRLVLADDVLDVWVTGTRARSVGAVPWSAVRSVAGRSAPSATPGTVTPIVHIEIDPAGTQLAPVLEFIAGVPVIKAVAKAAARHGVRLDTTAGS